MFRGVRSPHAAPQAPVLTLPLHSHPIRAQSLTAAFCKQGRGSRVPVSMLFLLLPSACFLIPGVTGHLSAHQLEPWTSGCSPLTQWPLHTSKGR